MSASAPPPAAAPITSPCINVCVLDPDRRWCTGCWRRLDEIAAWSRLDAEARRAVMADLPRRRAAGRSDIGA